MPNRSALTPLLWLAAVAYFMQTLDTSIVNTALPAIALDSGESPLHMKAIVVAYSLTMATLIPASGWLADRFGTRRVFFCAIALFVIGSALCAASPTVRALVAARVIQGAGGAMLMPVGRLAILHSFPAHRYLQALSFVTIPALFGPLLGPSLGGWLAQAASWHWIFLINVPVGLAGCAATLWLMPDHRPPTAGRFDAIGYGLLVAAMLALSLALGEFADPAERVGAAWLMAAIGLVALGGYVRHARRCPRPLFPLTLFAIPAYRIGIVGNLLARIGTGSMPYLLPLLLQVGLGFDPLVAGLMMLPTALAGMLAKRLVVPLIEHQGYRRVLVANTILVGISMAGFAALSPGVPAWRILLQLGLFGALNALQFTAMNTLTLKDLDQRNASGGNSLFSMMQMLAMSVGVTVGGAVLNLFNLWLGAPSGHRTFPAFQGTFILVGVITCGSALVFRRIAVRAPSDAPPSAPTP